MRTTQRERPATPPRTDPRDDRRETVEDIHVRNYDVERSYELRVAVRDDDGTVWTRRYALGPGQCRSETDLFDGGAHEVEAVLDPVRGTSARRRIGPDRAALVEVGNGVVSVSEGLY